MKYAAIYGLILLLIILKLSFGSFFTQTDNSLGSKENPIKLMLTPSVEANKVTTSADSLVSYLHNKTGLYFTATVPASFIVVVESFGSGAVDMAITNTFSYVLAHEKYGAEAAMMVLRRGGEKTYRGQIITHIENNINSLQDLAGKKFAYVDAASTSGYILPKAMLEKNNIKPSQVVFGGKHDNVVTMVYQKQVDAGATYYSAPDKKTHEPLDARIRVQTQFPDVFEKVKILELTEDIPNDPVVFRSGMNVDLKKIITKTLMDFQATKTGHDVLNATYAVEGLIPATDKDYDVLRTIIKQHGGDLKELLTKKK